MRAGARDPLRELLPSLKPTTPRPALGPRSAHTAWDWTGPWPGATPPRPPPTASPATSAALAIGDMLGSLLSNDPFPSLGHVDGYIIERGVVIP